MRIIIRSRMRINPDISPESRCMRLISPYHELLKSAFLVHSTTAVGFLFNWHFPPDITRGQTGTSTGIPKKYQVGFAECDTGRMPFPSPNQSVKSLKGSSALWFSLYTVQIRNTSFVRELLRRPCRFEVEEVRGTTYGT